MTSTRIVLNRSKLSEVRLALADGLLAVADEIVTSAKPPDEPPLGKGLTAVRGALVMVDRRKVGGAASRPRLARVPPGVVALGGFGKPHAHLVELGHRQAPTKRQRSAKQREFGSVLVKAQPFLGPAIGRVRPHADATIAAVTRPRLARP